MMKKQTMTETEKLILTNQLAMMDMMMHINKTIIETGYHVNITNRTEAAAERKRIELRQLATLKALRAD